MLSKSPSVAVRMMSPSWTSKEELSAASGLQGHVDRRTDACNQLERFMINIPIRRQINGLITAISGAPYTPEITVMTMRIGDVSNRGQRWLLGGDRISVRGAGGTDFLPWVFLPFKQLTIIFLFED